MFPAYTIRCVKSNRILGYSHHNDAAHDITVALSLRQADTIYAYETASTEVARYMNGQRISR
jgi:hypothetical protein